MIFEWDPIKNDSDKKKHGIDFESAKSLWNDPDRIEILTLYPVEDRYILIGNTSFEKDIENIKKDITAIFKKDIF